MTFYGRLRSDLTYFRCALRTLRATKPIARNPGRIFPHVIDELAERFGDKPALVSDREALSYRELAERSCRYTRWALAQGLRKDDVVALLMPNRPEYVAVWLGLTRAGVVVALINTNLVGAALAYCIDIVNPKVVVVAAELAGVLASGDPWRKTTSRVFQHGEPENAGVPRIDTMVAALDGSRLSVGECPALTIEDRALLIFTSGTTGMPKAANINHYRLMLASLGFSGVMDVRADDRMYDCLPMYHTSGGVVATGAVLNRGGTVFIREKFSAREFWDDVVGHRCTLVMYIGELCRYLVNSPVHPKEREHVVRLFCGNGLRPDVWPELQKRFAIRQILEFYAATEGNVALFNFEGKPGAVGRIPWFLKPSFPTTVVRFDVEAERPVRNAEGFCEEADPGEVGEAIGRILHDPAKPSARFEGYSDPGENERKILRDVFVAGDAWFRTGDLMRRDPDGNFYFIDRIGDTFRWKGENVSTTEVAEALGEFPGIREANVYGVRIPGRDGRAGMAAIVGDAGLDMAALRAHLAARLPDYARPLFLRLRHEIETTSTFKQRKVELVREGFDPGSIADPIYVDAPAERAYVRLDETLYRRILAGEVRL